jgi:AsmA protein
MRRVLKIAAWGIAGLVLIVVALPFLIDANRFRPELESRLTEALRRNVKVGELKLTLLSGGLTAGDLSVADDPAFSQTPFLTAKSLHVGVDLAALVFSRKLTVTSLTIDQPQIWLLESPSGDWNFSSLGTKSAPVPPPASQTPPKTASSLDLSVKLVKISEGRFTMGRTGGHLKPLVLEKVTGELHNFAAATAFPFSLSTIVAGGGSIKIDGTAGPLDQDDLASTPATVNLRVDKLDLVGSGVSEIAPEVTGLVSFDGRGQASAKALDLTGRLKIDKLKLSAKGSPAPRVLELDFHVTHDLKKRSGTIRQADVHFGGAVTHLTGIYVPQGESMAVHMSLAGDGMPVPELAQMLPALGIVLPKGASLEGGTVGVTATIEGPVDRLVTTGTISLNHTKLAGFNLSSKMSEIEKLAGIKSGADTEIDEFSGNLKMAPEGLSADSIKLVLPALGDLAGGGTVNPDNTLNFKMQANVHARGVAALLNDAPVPFTVVGTCSEPVFHPDLKDVVKGEVKGVGRTAEGLFKGLLGAKKQK